jgi:hypothetical protein
MKIKLAVTLVLLLALDSAAESTIRWWGLASFRQRLEISREYTDITFQGAPGELLHRTDNSTTKLGYQFGFIADVSENLKAGLTLRSGLSGNAQVMHQDITNKEGLLPAVQEAFLDWDTPYSRVELGKIPQAGNAMWDVYTSTLQTDFRADDPRDGIFNDRQAALNGIRISRPVGPVTLRGVFHTDYVGGYYRKFGEQDAEEFKRAPDRYVILAGFQTNEELHTVLGVEGLSLEFDYGFPHRAAQPGTNPDSTMAEEQLWGATAGYTHPLGFVRIGHGYNWRDSTFTINYTDVWGQANLGTMLANSVDLGDLSLSARYQIASEEMEFVPYKGAVADRSAFHVYMNKTILGLIVQPRVILFTTEIEGFKQKTQARYELTATVKF